MDWQTALLVSFLLAAGINALFAASLPYYYRKKHPGELTHSELKVKQGRADFNHRINIFMTSFIWSPVNLKVLLASGLLYLCLRLMINAG